MLVATVLCVPWVGQEPSVQQQELVLPKNLKDKWAKGQVVQRASFVSFVPLKSLFVLSNETIISNLFPSELSEDSKYGISMGYINESEP